ncbi:MAG: hypothetical protein H7Y31_14750 [Chitinophagaceae bacterium]|nr:hypothetical protein [Chitinophagaceae bacterium]
MERRFYNEDFEFEELIKQKSDQYKIYPSEKVWKGIHGTLHSNRRWYLLSLAFFLAGISYVAVDQITSPASSKQASNKSASEPLADNSKNAVVLPFTPPAAPPLRKTRSNFRERGLVVPMKEIPVLALVETEKLDYTPTSSLDPRPSELNNDEQIASTQRNLVPSKLAQPAISDRELLRAIVGNEEIEDFSEVLNNIAQLDSIFDDADNAPEKLMIASNNEAGDQQRINWLQENAVYELTRPKLKRVSWQVTAAPTMNYRRLTGNTKDASIASDIKNIPISLNISGDVEKLVNHKPAVGFEVGAGFLYAINKRLTFKSGVLFNYSRYDIQAYSSYSTEVATIALNNFYGTNPDSITNFTRFKNFSGNAVKDLENKYYQLSAPIGVEILVLGRGRLQLNVGATIQPTYLINRDNYLITTDYKNYTREPSLVRRWNVYTAAEAFLSYKTRGLRFQLGPQARYQMFSTYSDKYPVQEFLLEYGLKFGISKSIH